MTNREKAKRNKHELRHQRVRAQVSGTTERPRLAVFRSAQHIYAQVINDQTGTTLASASSQELKKSKVKRTELSGEVGKLIADKAKKSGVTKVVFDRGGYLYHGRVKALAEGAREAGLEF